MLLAQSDYKVTRGHGVCERERQRTTLCMYASMCLSAWWGQNRRRPARSSDGIESNRSMTRLLSSTQKVFFAPLRQRRQLHSSRSPQEQTPPTLLSSLGTRRRTENCFFLANKSAIKMDIKVERKLLADKKVATFRHRQHQTREW